MGKKHRKKRSSKTGLSPGSIVHIGEQKSDKIEIEFIQYNAENYVHIDSDSITEPLKKFDPASVNWLNINGLHDTDIIKTVGDTLKVNSLLIEDILNTEQRPKIEIEDDYVFVIMKAITIDKETLELNREQISFLLSDNYVVTFQEKEGNVFNLVKDRIEAKKGKNKIERSRLSILCSDGCYCGLLLCLFGKFGR